MLQAPNGTTRTANFLSNDLAGNSNTEAVEAKYSPAASEFQTSPDLNQRLSWQQPLTSPVTSEAGGYPHVPHQAQPHQSFLPHHNPYNHHHGGQTNYGLQPGLHAGLQHQASTAAGLYSAAQAAAMSASGGWPPQPHQPINVNYIMNSNVIYNHQIQRQPIHPVPAYYPTQ